MCVVVPSPAPLRTYAFRRKHGSWSRQVLGQPALRLPPRRRCVRRVVPPPPREEMRGPFPRAVSAARVDEVQDPLRRLHAEPEENLQLFLDRLPLTK